MQYFLIAEYLRVSHFNNHASSHIHADTGDANACSHSSARIISSRHSY